MAEKQKSTSIEIVCIADPLIETRRVAIMCHERRTAMLS